MVHLSKPVPEHTYAMIDRDFLCDCQLDLEHASVLKQLSACTGNKSAHLAFNYVVNMGFYQLPHTNRPNVVANVEPNIQKWPQNFQDRLFTPPSKSLDKPTDLLEIIDHMDDRCQKEPCHESSLWDHP